jgi:hypothetical protein
MILTRALSNTTKSVNSFKLLTCLAIAALTFNATARGASINYGNFNLPGIMFQDVTESSGTDPVPLYGPPAPYVVGLDFDPIGFTSNATNGNADITDGQLNFTVMSGPNAPGIPSISVFEAGDYSMAGAGGNAATSVFAGAILRATITQVNGLPVAPISVPVVNASFSDALPPNQVVAPWSLGLSANIAAALGPGQNATKVEVVINNTLLTTSQPGTLAFIAKKDFRIDIPNIPEPTTLLISAIAGIGSLAFRRSRG